MTDWQQVMADFPAGGLVATGVVLVAGLLLWGFGNRVLKSAMVLAGAMLGAAIGYVVSNFLALPVPDGAVALGGAALLGIFAWLSYRPAMGLLLAILLAVLSPMGVLAYAHWKGVDLNQSQFEVAADDGTADEDGANGRSGLVKDLQETLDLLRESDSAIEDLRRGFENRRGDRVRASDDPNIAEEDLSTDSDSEGSESESILEAPWIQKLRDMIDALKADVSARWEAAPTGVKRSLLLSTGAGFILGLLIGLSLPSISATLITALAGSGMVLSSGWTLLSGMEGGPVHWAPASVPTWLAVWLAAAALGMGIQWMTRKKKADTAG